MLHDPPAPNQWRLIAKRFLSIYKCPERETPDLVTALDDHIGDDVLRLIFTACHPETDWGRIVSLYVELAAIAPSPVVGLNRAVAVSRHAGPLPALELLEPLREDPLMKSYHLLPSVRGDLLSRLGRHAEARAEFELAAGMTQNTRERQLLIDRRASARRRRTKHPSETVRLRRLAA